MQIKRTEYRCPESHDMPILEAIELWRQQTQETAQPHTKQLPTANEKKFESKNRGPNPSVQSYA